MNTDRLATKATLLLVSSLTVMAGATIAPALPSIQAHFSDIEYSGLWIRLILTIPALFIVLAAPFTGWFIDRNGRLPLLIPAMILYGIAGSSGLYLGSVGAILAGRALLGIAVAGIMTGATTLIADYYQGQARAHEMVGAGPTASGLAIATVTLFAMVTSLGYGWIRKFMGYISIFFTHSRPACNRSIRHRDAFCVGRCTVINSCPYIHFP